MQSYFELRKTHCKIFLKQVDEMEDDDWDFLVRFQFLNPHVPQSGKDKSVSSRFSFYGILIKSKFYLHEFLFPRNFLCQNF